MCKIAISHKHLMYFVHISLKKTKRLFLSISTPLVMSILLRDMEEKLEVALRLFNCGYEEGQECSTLSRSSALSIHLHFVRIQMVDGTYSLTLSVPKGFL